MSFSLVASDSILHYGKNFKIHCGDALWILRGIESRSADMILTDPPYSSGGLHRGDRAQPTDRKYGGGDVFEGDSKDQIAHYQWSAFWMSEGRRILKPNGYLVAFTDWRGLHVTINAIQAAGLIWRGVGVWDKKNARAANTGFFKPQVEFWVWASRGKVLPSPGGPFESYYQEAAPYHTKRVHPVQKPVGLMEHILQPVKEGLILDPFAGSGTVGVAALRRGLAYTGIEMVPRYAEIAAERLRDEEDSSKTERVC